MTVHLLLYYLKFGGRHHALLPILVYFLKTRTFSYRTTVQLLNSENLLVFYLKSANLILSTAAIMFFIATSHIQDPL